MKRTRARTQTHPNLKISDADLQNLRRTYARRSTEWGIKTKLARRYGVSVVRISKLVADIAKVKKDQHLLDSE